jgi:transcription elongation factor Elf1
MVNYTVYQNWFDAYHQKKLAQHEFENLNAFLQELDDRKTEAKLKKEIKDMEEQYPIPQMSKMNFKKVISLKRELAELSHKFICFEYSADINPEHKDIFIPIRSAEKLPMRSELYTKEFKCLTCSRVLTEDDWNIRFLSGHYHDKSKRLFVQTLGDSYEMNSLQNYLLFRKCLSPKRKR